MNAAALTLAPTASSNLQLVQVLGVYWLQDDLAGEQGYGLHYCFAQGAGTGVTLLADERSDRDAPLYVGDWVRLRPVGQRRHMLVDNVTHLRAIDAVLVDWVAIAMERNLVAPAQLFGVGAPHTELPDPAESLIEDLDQKLTAKYPGVAAFLAGVNKPRVLRVASDEAFVARHTNGGW